MSISSQNPGNNFNPEDVKVWERIVDVQKHFNEVKSKNQTLFISIVTASLAATGYLFQNQMKDFTAPVLLQVPSFRFELNYYTFPLLGAAIFTLAFYILDYGVYHTLLRAAVDCGKDFEAKHLQARLTSTIIEEASEQDTLWFIRGAGEKLRWFYRLIGWCLFALFLILNISIG